MALDANGNPIPGANVLPGSAPGFFSTIQGDIQAGVNYAQQTAASMGLGFDPNPMDSPIAQAAAQSLNPNRPQTSQPQGQIPISMGSRPGIQTQTSKPVAFGFTAGEILLGAGGLFLLYKLMR